MNTKTKNADKSKEPDNKKTTKKERVENYLENLMNTPGFTVESLMNMTVYDLFGNAELEGIGKTTLSGALNTFKKKYGMKKPGKGGLIPVKNTKKERVERYLTDLMKAPDFTVEDLMNLTVYDLFGNAELEGIGKTTLSSGIANFKKKYIKIQYTDDADTRKTPEATNEIKTEAEDKTELEEPEETEREAEEAEETEEEEEADNEPLTDSQSFEEVFISTIEKEGKKKEKSKPKAKSKPVKTIKPAPETEKPASFPLGELDEVDIKTLKTMIERFKSGQMGLYSMENLELIELKNALNHFGIDYKTLVERYRALANK